MWVQTQAWAAEAQETPVRILKEGLWPCRHWVERPLVSSSGSSLLWGHGRLECLKNALFLSPGGGKCPL